MKKSITMAIAISALSFSSGHAADLIDPPLVLAPPSQNAPQGYDWDGGYVGINVGFGNLQGVFTDSCNCEDAAEAMGRQVGLFVGRNWQILDGTWMGIEGDISRKWTEIHYFGSRVGTDLAGSVRLRVGEEVGNALVYAAFGWTGANIYVQNPDDTTFTQGWTLGAGIDWALTDKTVLRAEYRFNNYSPATLAGVDVDFDEDVISIGIAHKF
ncbi:outer membrane protein [Agrobacterium fabrum]|uniref:outer membrane protein n=1 Tax=Agrobacterium fabrum TaxID=1176649 RepID=UPI002474FF97|nr:outer membrane beta-barrel protein [Agrobacterium fabrum]MDH6298809.1 outer membrane immunogenic protein [Agrobacterium fabrum]